MCLQYISPLQVEVVDHHLHARWNRTPTAGRQSEAPSMTPASPERTVVQQERQQVLSLQDQDCSLDEVMGKDMDEVDVNYIPLKTAEVLQDILLYVTLEKASTCKDFAGKVNREGKELEAFLIELMARLHARILTAYKTRRKFEQRRRHVLT